MHCKCGCIRLRAGSTDFPRKHRRPSSSSIASCASRGSRCCQQPFEAARGPRWRDFSKALASIRASPHALHPRRSARPRTGCNDPQVSHRRCRRQAARPALPAGRARHAQDQAPAHRRLRGRRLPLRDWHESWSDRCCSASMTTRAFSITSALRPPSPTRKSQPSPSAWKSLSRRPASPATRPAVRAAGAPRGPPSGSRYAPSSSSKCAMTTSPAIAFVMARGL